MEFTLKHYSCSLCGKNENIPVLTKQGFPIVKCRNCNFVFVNPRIENEQLSSIYRHNYFSNKDYGYAGYEQEKNLRIKNFERWLKDADRYLPHNKPVYALDVGCAAGYCLAIMKNKGWHVKGLELDEEMCTSLQQDGYDVSKQMLEDFESEKKFSVITLFDVIEHIPQIDKAFSKLHSLLADDGIVIMVTPDYLSLQRRLLGKKWFQFKPIEHIQYFDKHSLRVFAERNGLKIVHHSSCGQFANTDFLLNRLGYYHFTFLKTLFNMLFSLFRLKGKSFYIDTGSLFLVLKQQ